MTLDYDVVAEGLRFPEGPIAMADGSVLVVEIRRGTLTRVLPNGTKVVAAQLGGGPNGAAIGPDGAVYICNNGGFAWHELPGGIALPHGTAADYTGGSIQRVDLATGEVRVLYDVTPAGPLRGPNDIVFDSAGGFWFTDLGKTDGKVSDVGRLFYAQPDGSRVTLVRDGMVTPNGVGLSPDERTVYVAETLTGRLWGFALSGPGKFAEVEDKWEPGRVFGPLPGNQQFDSLAVDADGRICVATIVTGAISMFHPADGSVEQIAFPDRITTNICFGGDDMRTAWITCSSTGKLLRCRWPYPGLRLPFNA